MPEQDRYKKNRSLKTVVVLPAYNAEKTLRRTVDEIPRQFVDEIIMVDDLSNDRTVAVAEEMGLHPYQHDHNTGYGGNQKTCYTIALEHGADIIVMIHPDYQYDPKLIEYMVKFIEDGYFDVMLGSRIRTRKESLAGGMPGYKYYANRLLTFFENIMSGQNLSEWHTGMRAYKREVLKNIDFINNSDDFVFDSQVLFQIVEKGYRIGEIPVPVKYSQETSSINFKRSLKYGSGTAWEAIKYFFRNAFRNHSD